MNLEETVTSIDDNAGSEKPLYYLYVASQIEQAIEHLQDLLEKAKAEDLSESWFRINMANALTDLNRGYNLRYPENHVAITVNNASKLPQEIVEELGYTGKSIDEFVCSVIENNQETK
ncbi:MAG: hypothetical protein A3J07_04000 [Candidatus Doudnabacteria bacterium RIFCSPLOWO2_02_FULL_49_13]|uniref:Uncharacterized protein n=1 Tax=Candidatus Doudnabacteria bacterium RIFCSPHIGHO2_12_FULL_48_16 TaxID=1817838 RepID=A0A1F5PJP5_9BACT|nr:MAG: hypothetical protein A3B77_02810 [Candidatus Doudnabacteria bacterium RIFCSPHIGHO2_02_FULL_49_24]OGE90079.1 MAG: hypothetical protein A3E29_03145 [Candidatus Doudnabacteria bacterium RIFCSPHIGHO2_12_FULL_48_16]OGE90447.1 MAG: hypothetical protein A2760_00785 [Candidatus Doudnabacteria bacterium RIFCSPHIGHO2_01_FULL_50_67]OGE96503.1 MAG: hypothetical protein A2990_04530 [Candidatus Doudnabacteria bacterium RIFCSPLOWO2_01_FULL_49_40]OGF03222.1 MAG: hypothetical protein A3J07_04000 [Candid